MPIASHRLVSLLSAAAAAAALQGCGSSDGAALPTPAPAPAPAPVALTCDDSMKTAFKPDANTQVLLAKAFKAGEHQAAQALIEMLVTGAQLQARRFVALQPFE